MNTIQDTDLDRALRLADIADAITRKYYLSSKLVVTDKPDTTPVTQADTETEAALSKIVHEEFGDTYLGEEGTRDIGSSGRRWIVDPIDATRNFMRGVPIWATLIALSDEQGPLVSVVTAPAMGRRWWAVRGGGAFTSDTDGTVRQIKVSGVRQLSEAYLSIGSLFSWDKTNTSSTQVISLLNHAWRHRAFGDFLNYMLLAEGAIDACLESGPKQWDLEAPQLIVTEAGGSFWASLPKSAPADTPRIAVATNGKLESEILGLLNLG